MTSILLSCVTGAKTDEGPFFPLAGIAKTPVTLGQKSLAYCTDYIASRSFGRRMLKGWDKDTTEEEVGWYKGRSGQYVRRGRRHQEASQNVRCSCQPPRFSVVSQGWVGARLRNQE
jgi:hypothetical protein